MRRFLITLTFAFFCGILAIPTIDAQGRREGRNGNRTENTQNERRASNNRQANKPVDRNNNRNNVKKDNNHNNGNKKPQVQQPAQKPKQDNFNHGNHDNKQPTHIRPNYGNHNSQNKRQPGHGGNHYNPGHNNRPHHVPPPPRPYRPKVHVYHRPPTPASFCYHHRCPVIKTILGINLGTAFNISLNYLYGNGYIIDGYGNNMIHLRNATQMSMIWPDATLYYDHNALIGSEFSYSTSYYDMSRYNQLYSNFVTQYGSPMSYTHNGNHITATWWGQNSYVTLSFNLDYSSGGYQRYYTTLSFGL